VDPIELARRVAMDFFKAGQYLAAALVYGECLKRKPDDAGLLLGFGAAVGNSAGRLVVAPFVQWSTRILNRCLSVDPTGPNSSVAKERLAELEKKPEYIALPPIAVTDLEPLLEFLDVSPSTIMAEAVAALDEGDRMGTMMGLGELGSPRFASAIAKAVSGEWGVHPANAALKRIRPYAGHRIVRDALVTLRARPDADEFEPYLGFAENGVAATPITIETPEGFLKVRPPDVGPIAKDDKKPWWKIWN
jgi:hypothetical protein